MDISLSSQVRPPLCVPAVSCSLQLVPNLDGCCINDPAGHFLQTQFWDPDPSYSSANVWTVHGLWPDWCGGGWDAYCGGRVNESYLEGLIANASQSGLYPGLLDWMDEYWPPNTGGHSNLWMHEWNKHGTCISTLKPDCYARDQESEGELAPFENAVLDYFAHTALLYSSLPTFEFLARHEIVPSHDETYELEDLRRAVWESSHGADVIFKCRNGNELSEIWYSFHVRGSLRDAKDLWQGNHQWNTWVVTNPPNGEKTNCPATGIRYLPKRGTYEPSPTTTTHTHTATATATHTSKPSSLPFTGKGRLLIKVLDDETSSGDESSQDILQPQGAVLDWEQNVDMRSFPTGYTGCLIRKGNWFAANALSSCAIFTADDDVKSPDLDSYTFDDDSNYHLFTLASRFAPCSFVEGAGNDRIERQNMQPDTTQSLPSDTIADEPVDLSTLGSMYFSCSRDLPFQTILSNDATIGRQHTEAARRLTLGHQHKAIFFAEKVPEKNEQVKLWTDSGWGARKVQVAIYWLGV